MTDFTQVEEAQQTAAACLGRRAAPDIRHGPPREHVRFAALFLAGEEIRKSPTRSFRAYILCILSEARFLGRADGTSQK